MNAKLGGYLVGYGLKKKNGEEKRVIFDRPIHNTITKHCLNNLLLFNGTNAVPTSNIPANHRSWFFKSTDTSGRYGVFNSCALGNGTGETSVNDTDLKNRVSAQTTTKKTGNGWCGTVYDSASAVVKLRVSHSHTIDTDFTVKEIGWYNAILEGGSLNYTLSSRVQLDSFVDVEQGDIFFSIYEITISFQGVEKINDFFGYGSALCTNDFCINGQYPSFPGINTNGVTFTRDYAQYPTEWSGLRCAITAPYINDYSQVCVKKTDWNKLKPFFSGDPGSTSFSFDGTDDYVMDSFRRDRNIILSNSVLGNGIYAIAVCGCLIRFGTFDEDDNFTAVPVDINAALRIKIRQSWSTDLLTPTP